MAGSIDHVVPRSIGGKDLANNRLPAHRECNRFRGTREITPKLKEECLAVAVQLFSHWKNIPMTKRWARVRRLVRQLREHNERAGFSATPVDQPSQN
jgi:hypothetical protein